MHVSFVLGTGNVGTQIKIWFDPHIVFKPEPKPISKNLREMDLNPFE